MSIVDGVAWVACSRVADCSLCTTWQGPGAVQRLHLPDSTGMGAHRPRLPDRQARGCASGAVISPKWKNTQSRLLNQRARTNSRTNSIFAVANRINSEDERNSLAGRLCLPLELLSRDLQDHQNPRPSVLASSRTRRRNALRADSSCPCVPTQAALSAVSIARPRQ